MSWLISHTLPGLWLATTRRVPFESRIMQFPRYAARRFRGSCRQDRGNKSTSPARPFEVGLDMHAEAFKSRQPLTDRFARRAKANVSFTLRTMRGYRKRRTDRWKLRRVRIENQQHLVSAAIKYMATRNGRERLQSECASIEILDPRKIGSVKNRFKNSEWRGG